MSLVVFTGLVGVMIAPAHIHPFAAFLAVLAIALGSGAAGCHQHVVRARPRRADGAHRQPAAAGRPGRARRCAGPRRAAVDLLAAADGDWPPTTSATALLAAAILFYVFIYTIWLKRRTPQNIVIGGAAGAFPPMIGWAAVTGDVSAVGIALFLLIFLWTPPHFWALALYRSDDYRRAGVPMLPVVAGPRETKRQMLVYTLVLVPVALAPTLLGAVGWLYGAVALALSVAFIGHAVAVWRAPDDRRGHGAARRMFKFSLLYLAVLFAALPLDRLLSGMSVMADDDRRPGDTDRHRQQRGKNLFMLFFLLSRRRRSSSASPSCAWGAVSADATRTPASPGPWCWCRRHAGHRLRRGAALRGLLQGDRLRRHAAGRAGGRPAGDRPHRQGALRLQRRSQPVVALRAGSSARSRSISARRSWSSSAPPTSRSGRSSAPRPTTSRPSAPPAGSTRSSASASPSSC